MGDVSSPSRLTTACELKLSGLVIAKIVGSPIASKPKLTAARAASIA
jgi:hypothetical protein